MHRSSVIWALWVCNKDRVLAPPNQHRKHWYEYQSNPTINSEVQGLVSGYKTLFLKWGFTLNIYTEGGWPPIWSLHLQIKNIFYLIPTSMIPVQIWWCSDWIFVFTKKDPVLAPPDLPRNLWDWYQIKSILNSEVQGLVLDYKNIVLKQGFTLHIYTEGGWPLISFLHLHINCSDLLILISWIPV